MNVRMDFLAKQARIDYASIIHTTSLPICIPHSFARVTIDDATIHDRLQTSLSHHLRTTQAQSYWIGKQVLSRKTAKLIYYDAIGRASTLSRLSMRIFISK